MAVKRSQLIRHRFRRDHIEVAQVCFLSRHTQRMPPTAPNQHARHTEGFRFQHGVPQLPEHAFIGDPWFLPKGLDNPQRLMQPFSKHRIGGEVIPVVLLLTAHATRANAKDQPASADHVQCGSHLGQQRRAAVAHVGDQCKELDGACSLRQSGKGQPRLQNGVFLRAAARELPEVVLKAEVLEPCGLSPERALP